MLGDSQHHSFRSVRRRRRDVRSLSAMQGAAAAVVHPRELIGVVTVVGVLWDRARFETKVGEGWDDAAFPFAAALTVGRTFMFLRGAKVIRW